MKQICRTLKLRKYRTGILETMKLDSLDYIVVFQDKTYEYCIGESEVRSLLEKDHIKPIKCIFDMNDRIIVQRDVIINTDILK